MGFMNKLLVESKFKKSIAGKALITNRVCKYCKSDLLKYSKHIGYGDKMGTVYHYKVTCLKCKKRYHTKRTKYVYEQVKDLDWVQSKGFKNKIGKII